MESKITDNFRRSPDIHTGVSRHVEEYGIKTEVVDPLADPEVARKEYGIELKKLEDIKDVDCVIVAVAHNEFKEIGLDDIKKLYREEKE